MSGKTFDMSRSESNARAPTRIYASRGMPAHLKLKYRIQEQKELRKARHSDSGSSADGSHKAAGDSIPAAKRVRITPEPVSEQLDAGSPGAHTTSVQTESPISTTDTRNTVLRHFEQDQADSREDGLREEEKHMHGQAPAGNEDEDRDQHEDEDEDDDDDDDEDDGAEEEGSEDESEDETEALMRELAKIKAERKAAEAREAEAVAAEERRKREADITFGNPLMAGQSGVGSGRFAAKRRWDEDVIFRVKDDASKRDGTGGFVNDMLRSDFHKAFMKRYIR
ncbi:complexed with cef1p [Savitreella phatthalungensis]